MGALTEQEIFDCMSTNLKLAVESCAELATNPIKGPAYTRFREQMKLVDGCCRQASAWREDTRWLNIADQIFEARNRAGSWLRGHVVEGRRVKLHESHAYKMFVKLGAVLMGLDKRVVQLRDDKTRHVGMILPEMQRAPDPTVSKHQVLLPEGFGVTPGGVLMPMRGTA